MARPKCSKVHRHRPVGLFILGFLLALSPQIQADELERVAAVARGGATELALRLLDKYQPSTADQLNWVRWEKLRFKLLADKQRWSALAPRVDGFPPELPPSFVQWALTEASLAQLEIKDGVAARKYLRRLLWTTGVDTKQFAKWRRMVIRSYLVDNNVADAHTALVRYKQDYRVNNDVWRLLHAKVLLRAGRYEGALDVLQDIQSVEGKLLRLLAGLRSGIYQASVVKDRGSQLVKLAERKPPLQRNVWALIAESAGKAGDDVHRVIALEQALSLSNGSTQSDSLFELEVDDLWQAYEWLAETLGNRLQLLVGNDEAWLAQAKEYENSDQIHARALYAFLAGRSPKTSVRESAHIQLANSLFADGQEETVRWLYTQSKHFASLGAVPSAIRDRLSEVALKRQDIHFAARLLKGLDVPPADVDADQWSLRRARVFTYAGDFKAATIRLSQILDDKKTLTPDFADRYLQVLFDLQAVGQHAQAYILLESVFSLVEDPRQRREILFWMADSKKAMSQHQEAGELYLRSATFGARQGGDLWGQSARFHAAEALGKAGLVSDARDVYGKLLAHTVDQRRRALIQRNMQQLWLRKIQTTVP